ncbi:calpain family cysteine protease containing protein [Stylonychia lemnae]|uniref:Calpain family cysteine protease containing protein n=1 Tax=Stylonychia lemnae TaxID=5949 RepID=A0A078AZL5_STYLE|nr:calpain family cysteine protease containing protein [Stylonychia lemnae]|eukprot:CDW86248.1 calpain family cysteine protease containing protein [Stylonychia lemnae]
MSKIISILTALVGITSAGFLQDYSLRKYLEIVNSKKDGSSVTYKSIPQECYSSIFRWKKGIPDYKDILNKGQEWSDPSFPPDNSSLRWRGKTNNELASYEPITVWKRIQKLIPQGTVFGTEGSKLDIAQGSIGNCYYLAGVGAVSDNQMAFEPIFINKDRNNAGLYAINVWVRGIPTVMVVDDYMPILTSAKNFMGVRGGVDGSLWPAILEKAWAKQNANYENTPMGQAWEGMKFLQNVRSKWYPFPATNTSRLWTLVTNAKQKNFFIDLSTPGTSDKTFCNYTLVCAHAYTLYNAVEVTNNATGQVYRLYLARNPWRNDNGFTGTWNDTSPMWTLDGNNFAAALNHQLNTNDGFYWLNETEMVTGFNGMTISYYFPGWKQSWYSAENDDGKTVTYLIALNSSTQLSFAINFYHARQYGLGCKTLPSGGTMRLKNGPTTLNLVTTKDQYEYSWIDYTETPLAAGTYQMEIKIDWAVGDIRDYTFSIYSPIEIPIIHNETKRGMQVGKHHQPFTPSGPNWNDKVTYVQKVFNSTQNYTYTNNLKVDLIGARNQSGLGYKGNSFYYSYNKTVVYNSTYDITAYYVGHNNTFYQFNVTLYTQASLGTSWEDFEFTGDKYKSCVKFVLNNTEAIRCNCILNGYLGPLECGFIFRTKKYTFLGGFDSSTASI